MKKRLFFDIEVSANLGMFWQSGHKISIGPESIIKERAIICICYKWEGVKECHALTWDAKQCDKKMLAEFVKIANEADELIGHNGDKFDLAWIRTRCLYHGIQMFPKYVTIDTLKVARSKFKFNSNKLNYIAKFLGIGQKIHTDLDLWKTAKPILERWVSQQLGWRGLLDGLKKEAPSWAKILPTLPRLVAEYLEQINHKDQRPELDLLKQLLIEERRKRRQVLGFALFLGGFLLGALLILIKIHSL